MPARRAASIVGEVSASAFAPGLKAVKKRAESSRNGRSAGRSALTASSVGGPLEIVSWMNGRETRAKAAKVRSRATNMLACVSATGATVAESSSSARQNSPNPVLGETRLRSTGWPCSSAWRIEPKAALSCGPRPPKALPNPAWLRLIASRVLSSNMSKNWSMSTGSGRAAESGIVSPAARPREELPGMICRYLRPRGDLGRMMIVESTGIFSALLSRWRSSSAATPPLPICTGLTELTTPIREPPIRTSLPLTSASALGTSALRS